MHCVVQVSAGVQHGCDTNRAWFDDSCGYAWVQQSRVPLKLPKVCAVIYYFHVCGEERSHERSCGSKHVQFDARLTASVPGT
jgi:hypothetical protein